MTIRKMKIRREPWSDPGVLRNHRPYATRMEGRLKRESLSDPERIERLRWRALLRFEAVATKAWNEAKARIVELGDAFVAKGSEQTHGWSSLPREEATDEHPRHLIVEDRNYHDYGPSVCEDRNDFWDEPENFWVKPAVGRGERNSALEELAVEEHDAWWEEEELPRRKKWWKEEQVRRKALATPEKLAAGAAWEYANHLCSIMRFRVQRINTILLNSIKELDFLPKRPNYKHPVVVILNGRHYSFEARGNWIEAEIERWPHPGEDRQCVFTVPQFKLDESLIGKSREVVWTRFGEPPVVLGTSKSDKRANIWIYGSVGLRFGRDGWSKVEKILTPKEVSSLLKRAK